ncbi:MAG: ABC transporter ATP-binding protein [Dichotomicrobium sp.]
MSNAQHAGGSALLDVRIDSKVYPGANGEPVEAVRGFHLVLEDGSFTALLGPSGCGKTTILRIIADLDAAFDGHLRWQAPPRIGFVFQEPNLLPWRTVRQNIELTQADAFSAGQLDELARRLGLAELMGRFPSELSLGLARRVALARAFASAPNVLLLDEPFASLDESTASRLRALLLDVRARWRVTTLLVTHNLREAIELADRLILLAPRPGHVVADLPITLPRAQRNSGRIDELRRELMDMHPAVFAQAGQDSG